MTWSPSDDEDKTQIAGTGGQSPGRRPTTRLNDTTVADRSGDGTKAPVAVAKPTTTPRSDDATRVHLGAGAARASLSKAPVGWLVVTGGPGIGNAFPLFYGSNRVGRGSDIEVPLNFEDTSMSRGAHARVTYDGKGRRFFVQPGEGTGLTYLNGEPVLTPVTLEVGTEIEIGRTRLRFVALCGPSFDWADLDVDRKD